MRERGRAAAGRAATGGGGKREKRARSSGRGGTRSTTTGRLVVSLLLQPAARVAAQVEAPDLVVDEDRQHERDRRQPPHEPAQRHTALLNSLSTRVIRVQRELNR